MSILGPNGQPANVEKTNKSERSVADNPTVRDFHMRDDVDFDSTSHHHTIGDGVTQAARGSDVAILKQMYDSAFEFLGFGAWNTAAPTTLPGTCATIPFTAPYAGMLFCNVGIQGFHNANAEIRVGVYLDNVFQADCFIRPTITATVRMQLSPLHFIADVTKGIHYLGFRQTLGFSNTDDRVSINGFIIPKFVN